MLKRTTIEIDAELLERAKRALGSPTTRATVEEALRRASEAAEREFEQRRARQIRFFDELDKYLDLDVLASDEMWR
jgi:Arc/MetJ family transcription regulator